MINRKLTSFVLLVALFLFVSISSVFAKPLQTVRFALANNMVSAMIVVADEKGFLAEEGIKLDRQITTNAKMSNDLLLGNHADMMTGAEGPITWLSFSPHSIKYLAQTHTLSDLFISARKDLGIKKESDLLGKKIGYLPGTVSFIYFSEWIEANGWKPEQFILIPLQPPAMSQALIGGLVDATVIWQPWSHTASKQLGDKVIEFKNPELYSWIGGIMGREDFIQENPKIVKGFMRALIKAEKFIKENKNETIDIVSNFTKIDKEYLQKNFQLYNFDVKISSQILKRLERNAQMIIKYSDDYKDKKVPDFKSVINSEYLKSVDPKRVTLK